MEISNTDHVGTWMETCARCGRRGEIGLEIWMDADRKAVCADGCPARNA